MHASARRVWSIGIMAGGLLTLLVTAGAPRRAAAQECDPGICQGDPCTITGVHNIGGVSPGGDCDLHWDNQDVTLDASAKLVLGVAGAHIFARNFRLLGSIESSATDSFEFLIITSQDFTSEGHGRLRIRRRVRGVEDGYVLSSAASIGIEAGRNVTLNGAGFKASGAWLYLHLSADADIQVNSTISVKAFGDDFCSIDLGAHGSLTTTKGLIARGAGTFSGSFVSLGTSTGDVTIGGALYSSMGKFSGFNAGIQVDGGRNVTVLKNSKVITPNAGGSFKVEAAGDITVLGSIRAKGINKPGPYTAGSGGQVELKPGATGKVVMPKTINVSCLGGCPTDGSITIDPGCYTDLTGAKFYAKPNGDISLGCACIHPTGSTTCDGGCVGLDSAKFDPPVSTSLPACS